MDTSSNAAVNLKGNVRAEGNLIATSKAVNTSVGSLVLKFPKVNIPASGGNNQNGGNSQNGGNANQNNNTNQTNLLTTASGSPYVAAAIVVNVQDTNAVVNFGTEGEAASSEPKITAGGGLVATAASVNTLNSSAVVAEKDDTAVNTAINVGVTNGNANVNAYTTLSGGKIQLNSQNVMNSLSMTTDASSGVEPSGLDWTMNLSASKEGVQRIGEFLNILKKGEKEQQKKQGIKDTEWSQAFNIGTSIAVVAADNKAITNVAGNAQLISGTDLDILASTTVGDTLITTKNLYNNMGRPEYLAVSTALAVEVMENTAEVNIADASSNGTQKLQAFTGDVNISATVDNSYNRVDKLLAAVESGWAEFLDHWSNWGNAGLAEKVDDLQVAIADILTMRANDPAKRFADSKQYTVKAKAAIDLLTQLSGTDKLKSALEGLCNAANYANMYVAASTDKADDKLGDAATVATGAIGIQYIENNAKVNIGANRNITAGNGKKANLVANVTEENAILIGKWSLIPDLFNTNAGSTGIGGSANGQTTHNTSEVIINKGVEISAGDINIATNNDIVNIGLVMGGSQTSSLGITGMVNYMGGRSYAKTLVDDDVTLAAQKTWGTITTKDEADNEATSEGFLSNGVVNISADNNAVIVNLTGDVGYSNGSAVGVALGIADYDIKTLAQMQNMEASDTAGKGHISANSVNVNAHTDGVINTFTVAGSMSSTKTVEEENTKNANKDAGGTEFKTQGGKGQNGVENQELKAEDKSSSSDNDTSKNETENSTTQQAVLTAGQGEAGSSTNQTAGKTPAASAKKDSTIKVDAAGSVSWNYVADETKAALDNVNISLTRPNEGTNVTTGVSVMAEDSSYIGSYSGAAAISKIGATDTSKFQASLSGAVAVNDLYKTTEASLKNAIITNADNVSNRAQNSGAQVALGLSVGVEIGQRGSGTSINMGASSSANYVDSDVHANMIGNSITGASNGSLNVNNIAYDKDVQVGGGVAFELAKGSAAAGGAISINDVDNSILARMEGNTIGSATALAGSIKNLAVSNLVQVGTATSVGVLLNKGHLMGDVAIAVNMLDNDVQAQSSNDSIFATSFTNAARDGKLEEQETVNQYIGAINSTQNNGIQVELGSYTSKSNKSFVINVDGDYVYSDPTDADYGKIVPIEDRPDGLTKSNKEYYINDRGEYIYSDTNEPVPESDRPDSLTMNAHQGDYYVLDKDTNGNETKNYLVANGSGYVYKDSGEEVNLVTLARDGWKVSYNEETGEFKVVKDNQERFVVVNPNRTYTYVGGTEPIDVTASADAAIVDLNVDNALANANGSTGIDIGLNTVNGELVGNQHYTNTELDINDSGNVIVGSAIGLAIKAGGDQSSAGAAVATNVNDVTNSFNASVTGSAIKVNGADGVQIKAESNTVMVALAAGSAVSVSSGGLVTVDVAGSGVANTINNDTIAKVENSSVAASQLAVDAATNATLVSTAGQLSVAVSQNYGGASGLTWAQNSFDNTTGAYVRGISLSGFDNGNTALAVNAYNNSDMYTIGAGVSGGWTNGALVGAYAANYGKNNTEAIVEKYTLSSANVNNTITNATNIAVKAEDDSDIVTVAGSLGLTGSSSAAVTVGGAVANTNIGAGDDKQSVRAALNDATVTMAGTANGTGTTTSEGEGSEPLADVSVRALNDANVVNLALGGGVAVSTGLVGVSAEGSVSVADVHSETLATMNNVNLTAGSKTVKLLAKSDGDIVSSADAFNAVWGSTAEGGLGATVSVLNSDVDTKTNVNGGSWSVNSAQIEAVGINSIYDIAMGFNAGGSTMAAVNGQANVAVNTLDNDVEAVVDGASITAGGDVNLRADSDETLHNYAGALAGAGSGTVSMGVGATVVVNTVNGNTLAALKNSTVNADDLLVQAKNKRRINGSQTGIGITASAMGAGALIASVAVHDLEGSAAAIVDKVNGSLHSLTVDSQREQNIDTYNNGFALSGAVGSGSVGVGVTVLQDSSSTLANLSNANLTNGGSKDSTNKVQVSAANKTDAHTEVSSNNVAASLGASIGVAVEVVNLEAQSSASVGNANVGTENNGFAAFNVTANNELTSSFQNVTDAVSTLGGIGVGVGVLNVNGITTASVDNARAYADNIQVSAAEARNVNTVLAGVNVGALAVGVNLMYTNIGGQLADAYTYDYGTSTSKNSEGATVIVDNIQKDYYTTKPEGGSLPVVADVQGLANAALKTAKTDVSKLESNQFLASGSSDSSVLASMNKGSDTAKVETKITGGSELHAAQNLNVGATSTNTVNGGVYQGSVNVVSVGVMANRIDVQEKQRVDVSGSSLKANKVHISSNITGAVHNTIGMGVAGALGYSDVVAEVNHSGSNTINVSGSAITATEQASSASEDALQINAGNSMVIDNKAVPVSAQVVSTGRTVVKGNDAVAVNINLGNDSDANAKNSFATQGITISAHNTPQVKNYIPANVNLGFVTGHGTIVESTFAGSVGVDIAGSNAFTTQGLAITGQVGELIDHSQDESNRTYTTYADNLAVNVAVEDISVNKSTAANNAQINMNVGAISLAKDANAAAAPNVAINAFNYATTKAKVHSVDVSGIMVTGTNFANTTDNSAISLTVNGGDTGLQAHNLTVQAQKNTEVYANAYGATSGIMAVSPAAAEVHHSSSSTTTVNVQGKLEAAGALNVQANSNDSVNLKADALTVTGFGDGDASVQSAISNVTTINVNNAELTSVGSLTITAANDISLNKGESKYTNLATNTNLDDNNEYSEMLWGQGYGLGAVGISDITNSVTSSAKVLLKNTEIESTGGSIAIAGYTNEDLLVNGYVFSVGILGNDSITNVTNTIINDEAVELEGSSITTKSPGNAITLSAADDLKLFTYALTETPTGVAGGSDADLKNTITRSNAIDLKNANNRLYSTQDINLYAGKKLDGNVAVLDLDAEAKNYNGNMIPGVLMPTVENIVTQNNSVTIAANSNSNSVRHTNIYADAGQELVRVYAARDTSIYGSSSEGGYVTEASGDEKYDKTSNNKVDINGSVVAGSGNVIHITIGAEGDIAIFNAADRAALTGVTALDEAGLKNKLTIEADPITGITKDNITMGRASYTLFLLNRYNEVMALLEEYSKDGATLASDNSNAAANAAYLGYQAEADRLRSELLNNGGMYMDEAGVYHIVDTKYIDYVEIPSLIASGGNITIQTDTVSSSSGSGRMTANGSADIDIVNNTNLLLKLNTITVDADGGKLVYNGQVLKPENYTTEGINEQLTKLNEKGTAANFASVDAKAGEGSSINIEGNYSGAPLNYQYSDEKGSGTGIYTPMADIWVQGNILNQTGAVAITSQHNNIRIAGASASDAVAISGKTVALSAGGSITQSYTDGVVSVGGSVESIYGIEFGYMKNNHYGQTDIEIKETAPANGQKATGSYIAGGSIYINAADININGVVQSGYGDYYLDMTKTSDGEGAAVEEKIAAIIQNYTAGTVLTDEAVKSNNDYKVVDGGAYWDMYENCYKYKLNAYYNPYTGKIIVEDVDASGGKIYLTGRIVSTGRGKLICLDGVSNINIKNGTGYGLQVGNLLTHDVEGVISIIDTAAYSVKQNGVDTAVSLVTTIKKNSTDVKYLAANGQYITPDSGSAIVRVTADSTPEHDYIYNPKSGLRYTWTEGEQKTTYVRYEKDVMDGGWGLWSLEEEQQKLAEWSTTNNKIGDGSTDGAPRLPNADSYVIEDAGDTSKTHMDYSSKTLNTPVYTVESDTVYHSGVFGCHEHHKVVWTESTGTLETYHASVKADQPIYIKFIGHNPDAISSENSQIAAININSSMGVDITGSVGNTQVYKNEATGAVTEKGIIKINTLLGSIEQKSGSLYGAGIELLANQGIKGINIVAGDNIALALLNFSNDYTHNADVTVNSAVGAKGNLALATVDSGGTGGYAWKNLDITNNSYQGDICKTSSNTVSAGRINLTTLNGSIYGSEGKDSAFVVNVAQDQFSDENSLSASLNASAYGDINIKQANGDLRLGRVYSKTGDVTLEASGSLVDALPTEVNNKGTAAERIARWKQLGMVGGDGSNATLLAIKNRLVQSANAKNNGASYSYEQYDENALLYTVAESIVNPNGSNLTKTSSKDPNVIGHNITLTAGNSIGYNSGTADNITLTGILKKNTNGEYINSEALSQLQKLAGADVTNVSITTDDDGKTVAVVQNKQAVGVQQITSLAKPENGQLTVTAKGNDSKGYILLEGRQEVGNDSFIGSDNVGDFVDLYVNSINSDKGEVNLTSLGSIYNNADASSTVNIKGKSLYITAVGALGTSNKLLTTDVFGTSKTTDGLSAVAGGNIYLNQISDNNLILRNISSSKPASSTTSEGGAAGEATNKREIYLGANKSILMGTNGTAEDYYLRADGLELTLEAREGSIGEAVYESGTSGSSELSHTANNGVRVENVAESDTASKVLLKAKQDIYVTGITNAVNGQTPGGVLNLEVAPAAAGVTQENIGIVVDGSLNLLEEVQSSNTASVYTTTDLLLNNQLETISSSNVYVGSAGDVTINGAKKIQGTDSVTVAAGQDVLLNVGHLVSDVIDLQASQGVITEASTFILQAPTLNANAKGNILMDSHVNQLQQVNVTNTSGSIAVGNGNITDAALSIAINNNASNPVVGGDLTVHNYNNDNGKANNIVLANVLTANGDITIINEEADVTVGAGGAITAKNITLQADNNAVLVSGGSINATSTETDAGNITLKGKSVQVSGGSITANAALINAGTGISIDGGSISVGTANLTAGTDISMTSGSITADNATLTATNGAILESDGFVLDTAALSASAHGSISLASKDNQLAAVQLSNTAGDVTVYNENADAVDLNISILNEGSQIKGNLLVHNFKENNGAANSIVLNKQLTATGDISLINDEADINVAADAALAAQNITLQANNNAVVVSGGSLTAASDAADAGVVTLQGKDVSVSSGEVTAITAVLTTDTVANNETIEGNNVVISGGQIKAATANIIAKDIEFSGGELAAATANLTAVGAITEAEGFALLTPVLNTSANGVTDLKSTSNQLEQVLIKQASGSVTIASTNRQNENALVVNTANNTEIQGDFSVINYADSSSNNNAIVVSNALQASGNITITNQEAAIAIKDDVLINANDIVLTAATDLNLSGDVTAAHDASLTSGAGLNIAGALTSANATTLKASAITVDGNVASTNGKTKLTSAGDLSLSGSGTVNGNTVEVNAQNFTHAGSTISADSIAIIATNDVLLKSGALNALNANASSSIAANNGAITEYADYAVRIPQLNVSAIGGINLSNQNNTLQNVVIGAAGSDVSIVSGNEAAGDLRVKLAQTSAGSNIIAGDLSITNIAKGAALNKIVVDDVLRASGTIELINKEADVEIAGTIDATTAKINVAGAIALNGGSIESQNANLQATGGIAEVAGFALQAANLYAHAGGSIALDSQSNKLGNVFIGNDAGDVSIGNGGDASLYIALLNDDAKVAGDLRVTNYDSGEENAVHFNRRLEATGDITIINQETGIHLGSEQAYLKAKNISLQASADISLTGGAITAAEVTLNAGSISENDGFALETPILNITSAGAVALNSKLNQLEQVKLVSVGGSVAVGSGNKKNSNAFDISVASALPGDLTVINYNDNSGNNNLIVVPSALQTSGDITLINEEAAITIGQAGEQAQNASMQANKITLQAMNHDVIVANGTLAAANVALTGKAITLSNGSILANRTTLTATKEMISEQAGFILNTDSLNATAVGEIRLASQLNQLAAVDLANSKGDITVYNANTEDQALSIALLNENAIIDGNLVVHNFDEANGAANKIVMNNELIATGNIEIINEEAAIKVANGAQLTARNIMLTAGNETQTYDVNISNGVLTAGTVTVDKAKDILLNAGSIVADKVILAAAESINETAGFALETSVLETSANGSITLASHANQLEQVDIKHAGSSVTIGSANGKNANALQIKLANKVNGHLQVTNYSDGSGNNNNIEVPAQLQATGSISLINEEAAIEVAQDAVIDADRDVILTAAKELRVNGNVSADNDVSMQANGIVVNGSVSAINKAELNSSSDLSLKGNGTVSGALVNATANQNFIHTSGTINAGDAVLNVGRNILLQGGKLLANNATLSAGGSIAESYDNANNVFNGYNLQIADGLTVQASNANAEGVAIDLGSRFNKLYDVVIGNANGDVLIANGATGEARLAVQSVVGTSISGSLVVHNYDNRANGELGNNLRVLGSLQANEGITLINDERDITMGSLRQTDIIASGGPIVIQAANNVRNAADIKSTSDAVSIIANNDLLNDGIVETASGNITLTSNNGMIFNSDNADLLTSGGDVSLWTKGSADSSSNSQEYFYYTDLNAQTGEFTKVYVDESQTSVVTTGSAAGKRTITVGNKTYTVFQKNTVYNAGDIVAMNGTITLKSENGNVANFNDFKRFVPQFGPTTDETKYQDKDITTGSIIMSAANGKLINNVDLEAGKDVVLIAKEGLASFGYDVYAGENISLTATDGVLFNTSTLESVKGNITLTAEHGNVINGTSESNRAGDIITLGGTVTLKAGLSAEEAAAKGQAVDTTAYSVTNYGDIIAVNRNNPADSSAGSIVLQSAYGNVNNYDDFNTYSKNADAYLLTLAKDHHKSAGLTGDIENYNLATSNITLSAVNGAIVNSKDYLVALGDVTMEAQTGIGSAGQVILAGGSIKMRDTDGDLLNNAKLISVNGDIILSTALGSVINEAMGDAFALNGNITMEATGDAGNVINWGDLVALNENNVDNKGGITLHSANGNVENYDEFKLVDGQNTLTFWGESGYANSNGTAKFNPSTPYAENRSYILTDADLRMEAPNGSLKNTMNMNVAGDITLISGNNLVVGVDVQAITAGGNVSLESKQGTVIINNSNVTSSNGSVAIDGEAGVDIAGGSVTAEKGSVAINGGQGLNISSGSQITAEKGISLGSAAGDIDIKEDSKIIAKEDLLLAAETGVNVEDSNLQSLNGSLSAVAMYGDVNIRELAAAEMVAVGSGSGSVTIGTIQGKEVVLYTENSNAAIDVETIKAQDSLVLQGDKISVADEVRSTDNGQLLVDITGAEGGTMEGELKLDLSGDVRFTNLDVSYATINVDGPVAFERLHTSGELHIVSKDMVTSIYGTAPVHDRSNYTYYSLNEEGASSGEHEVIHARDFALDKAQKSMATIHDRLANVSGVAGASDVVPSSDGSMYLYIESPTYQRSNGLLLHIDTGYRAANQRWSAEDLSAKLVDYKAYDSFVAHYGDVAGAFGRYDLLELAPRSVSEIVQAVQHQRVVLQQANGQLRIVEKQPEQGEKREREERRVANE